MCISIPSTVGIGGGKTPWRVGVRAADDVLHGRELELPVLPRRVDEGLGLEGVCERSAAYGARSRFFLETGGFSRAGRVYAPHGCAAARSRRGAVGPVHRGALRRRLRLRP